MIYILFNIYFFLFTLFPNIMIIIESIITFFIFTILLYTINTLLYEEGYLKFYNRKNVELFSFINPKNNNEIIIPLDYRISDILNLLKTLFFIFSFICVCIIPFIVFRFYRLGNKIDLISLFDKYTSLPFPIIIMLLFTIYNIWVFSTYFWLNLYTRFYKEIKKLYLYFSQFKPGPPIDHRMPRTFLQKIEYYSAVKWELVLYRKIKNLKSSYRGQFLYYHNDFTLKYAYFLEELEKSIKLFYGIIPIFILIITLLYEIIFHNFVLTHIYYILLGFFIYKQFYNLMYFSWYHHTFCDKAITFYYYNMDRMQEEYKYHKEWIFFF